MEFEINKTQRCGNEELRFKFIYYHTYRSGNFDVHNLNENFIKV